MNGYTVIETDLWHPDHDVVGDLVQNDETKQYFLLSKDGGKEELHSVPHTWALGVINAVR